MEHFKHTPGPWLCYADTPSTEPDWHVVTNAYRNRVLANVHIEPGNQVDVANARLIAAAPDMLEAMASAIKTLAELNPHLIPTTYETPTEQHQRECVTDAYHTLLAAYNLAIKGW